MKVVKHPKTVSALGTIYVNRNMGVRSGTSLLPGSLHFQLAEQGRRKTRESRSVAYNFHTAMTLLT